MFKLVATQIKLYRTSDRDWWHRYSNRLVELEFTPLKVYQVLGREDGLIWFEWPEFATWEEGQNAMVKISEDMVIQQFVQEREEKYPCVPGSSQWYLLMSN